MSPDTPPFVVAIVATYRRAAYVEKMLASLCSVGRPLAVILVDNADDPETKAVAQRPFASLEITRLVPGANLSCGGGLEYGERDALTRFPRATHFWVLDDDTEIAPGMLDLMLAAMEENQAQVACPSVLDKDGRIAWFPGLVDSRAFGVIKKRCSLEEYLSAVGDGVLSFTWATGVSLLVTRAALEKAGLHRADFWIRGEDIEFSLRLTYHGRGIYVPRAVVHHYPPVAAAALERQKEYFMLRNHFYIALHAPHGRRIFRNLCGAVWRFFRNFGLGSWPQVARAVFNGASGRLGPPPQRKVSVVYSLADQNFATTKSIGILNLSTALVPALAGQGQVDFLTVLSNSTLPPPPPSPRQRVVHFDWVLKNKFARMAWDQWAVYGALPVNPGDWLFLPKGYASFLRKPPCKLAVYVHDAMLEHYATHYPGRMSRLEVLYFRTALKATLRNASVIFTNSAFTRGEVLRLAGVHGITPPPVVVAGIGFAPPARTAPAKKNQVLFLASKWPHKLTRTAIEYADRWQRETQYNGQVLWVGALEAGLALPGHQRWSHFERLSDEPFQKMIGESRALVFFSEYEGFGMPPVEALLHGACPVYSDIPSTREVMKGKGASFENGDYASFAKAMETALHSDAATLQAWSRELLEANAWTNVAGTIAKTLVELGEDQIPAQRPDTKFWIVTPSFRSLPWLTCAVASVADQAGNGVQVHHHVQDGGSDDGTREWLEAYAEQCARAPREGYTFSFESAPDQGMYDAINKGWGRAPGDFAVVGHLNSDEQYLPGALQAVARAFAAQPGADMILGDAVVLDGEVRYICHQSSVKPWPWMSRYFCVVLTCTAFYRRDFLVHSPVRFDTSWHIVGDMVFYHQLLQHPARVGLCNQPTTVFLDHGANLALGPAHRVECARYKKEYGGPLACFGRIIQKANTLRRLWKDARRGLSRQYGIYLPEQTASRQTFKIARPKSLWKRNAG